MQLTPQDLEEFKAIYRREFDTELTDAQAMELAQAALILVQVVHRPLPPETQRECLSG